MYDTGTTNTAFNPDSLLSPPDWLLTGARRGGEHKQRERTIYTETGQGSKAVIQAGGQVAVTATQQIQNGNLKQQVSTDGPTGTRLVTSATGGTLADQGETSFTVVTASDGSNVLLDDIREVTQARGGVDAGEQVDSTTSLTDVQLSQDSEAGDGFDRENPVDTEFAVPADQQSIVDASENQHKAEKAEKGVDSAQQADSADTPVIVELNKVPEAADGFARVNPLESGGFALPEGDHGLFNQNTDPDHPYLIETNPAFANYGQFVSSDYMLDRLNLSDDITTRRLGDGFYEQRLIRQAIVEQTGQRFLTSSLTSDYDQYLYLMNNAVAAQESLSLSAGIALTAEQVAALTHDIVWLEEKEVAGQTVLVPVLYLAQTRPTNIQPDGALIAGSNVQLISGGNRDGSLVNEGTLAAFDNLTIQSRGDFTNSGVSLAGQQLVASAQGSIVNRNAGVIRGSDVSLTAVDGDVRNERQVETIQWGNDRHGAVYTLTGEASRIEATNQLNLNAGRDIQITGSTVQSAGELRLDAQRDIHVQSVADRELIATTTHQGYDIRETINQLGSEVSAGSDLKLTAGNDIAAVASTLQAEGNAELQAGNNVTLLAAANEDRSAYFFKNKKEKNHPRE